MAVPSSFLITRQYAEKMLSDVDKVIRTRFYSTKLSNEVWPAVREKHRAAVESSRNLQELGANINAALKELHSSHTQFVTINDEAYYFLLSLFFRGKKDAVIPEMTFTGAITGGVDCAYNQIRYILDASPAQESGLKIGDEIISVDGKPYIGQLSFEGKEKQIVHLLIKRQGQERILDIRPISTRAYPRYVGATLKSVRVTQHPEGKIGYVHLWSGGTESHDAWEEALQSEQVQNTDALIVDFRDGYGGNSLEDLDFFYRSPKAYPNFITHNRKGKENTWHMYYDRPIVALINGGVRSGKELLSYSLKVSGRGKLVGQKTAGAVLAGSVFPLGGKAALYCAVASGTIDGITLEGNGVEPDVEIQTTPTERGFKDVQYLEAEKILREQLRNQPKDKPRSSNSSEDEKAGDKSGDK